MDYREKRQREEDRAAARAHRRQALVGFVAMDDERERLNERARALGLSSADYLRSLVNADFRSAGLVPLRVGRTPYGSASKFVSMDTIMGVGERRRPGQPKPKAVRLGELVPREPVGAYTPRVPPKPKGDV
jgi:hypothetical protein